MLRAFVFLNWDIGAERAIMEEMQDILASLKPWRCTASEMDFGNPVVMRI
jgi:hypothetical protein